jgi:hypothetical protein
LDAPLNVGRRHLTSHHGERIAMCQNPASLGDGLLGAGVGLSVGARVGSVGSAVGAGVGGAALGARANRRSDCRSPEKLLSPNMTTPPSPRAPSMPRRRPQRRQ